MKLPSLKKTIRFYKVLKTIRLVGEQNDCAAEAGTEMEVVNRARKGRKMGIRLILVSYLNLVLMFIGIFSKFAS